MKFKAAGFFIFALCFLVGSCGHLPPPRRVKQVYCVNLPIESTRKRCKEVLIDFLESYGEKVYMNETDSEDLVSCTVVNGKLVQSHWNILFHPTGDGKTRIAVYRYILARRGYVPLSAGKEEKEFVNALLKGVER